MKVSTTDEKAAFKPIVLVITLESEQEVKEFYALHNVGSICEATPSLDHEAIKMAANPHRNVSYHDVHNRLCGILKD